MVPSSKWLTLVLAIHTLAPELGDRSPLTLRFDVIHGGTRGLDGDLAGTGAPPCVVYRPQSEPRGARAKDHVVQVIVLVLSDGQVKTVQ